MQEIYGKLFIYVVIVLSAVIHEYAHAFMANELGDSTAKDAGRLTVNPLPHMDLMGTVILPLILLLSPIGAFFGYAKPVPVNPHRLQSKRAMLKVSLAGPIANLILAVFISLSVIILNLISPGIIHGSVLGSLIGSIIFVNITLFLFNLIPIPPLDGSKIAAELFGDGFIRKIMILGPFSLLLALWIGMMILPKISSILFNLITGFGWAL